MRVEIRLLGGFEVDVDGRVVTSGDWRRHDPAALFKVLALADGHRLLRDQVLDTLWPDKSTELAAPRMHKAAHYARAVLNDQNAVVLDGNTVSLFPDAAVGVDLEVFERASAAALSGSDPRCAQEAISTYRGDLLPQDLYESWTEQPRERARLRYLELLRMQGRWDLLVQADPTDEDAHLHLARDMLARGDPRSAVAQLDQLTRVLHDELDALPGEEAVALRRRALATPAVSMPWEQRASRRAPVPRPATPTVGRTRDLEAVLELLKAGRVLTLLGPGGVGKTRLAAEAALRYEAVMTEAACFVDLTQAPDPRDVPRHVAHALGVEVGGSAQPEPALAEALRGRSLLIVLDNFEHVLDAGTTVARLAQVSPGITWLVTSRARLRIAPERVFEVFPLSVEPEGAGATSPGDAVVLFGQVATAVNPEFDLSTHRADVVEICRTVDGLPLAVELAARHVHTMSPPLLRARLSARLASSTGAARDLPARQHTIPATIDWSLELLGRTELELFVRLGVFATPVSLETIERVCRDNGQDLVDPLTTLCDHSLVRRITAGNGEPRFDLLHLLRQRAHELAAGHDLRDVRLHHARWVASVLEETDGRSESRPGAEREKVVELMPDIRAAHSWAAEHDPRLAAQITAALGPYWHREGHHDEGRAWVRSGLADPADLDEKLVAQLHLAAGIVEWPRDQQVARSHWTRAIELFSTLGREHDLAYATALAAVSHVGIPEDYADALRQCEDAIALARRVGDRSLVARTLNMKGELARVAGDDALALEAYQEGHDLAVAAGDDVSVPLFLGNLSFLADHRGDQVESLRLSLDAVQRAWAMGRRMMAAGILSQLAGAIHLGLGEPELAARLIGASDEALSTIHVQRHPCDVPEHERIISRLHHSLGHEEFDRLRDEGCEMSLDDAVKLAVEAASAVRPDRQPSPDMAG